MGPSGGGGDGGGGGRGGIEVGRGEGKEGFEVEGILLMTC